MVHGHQNKRQTNLPVPGWTCLMMSVKYCSVIVYSIDKRARRLRFPFAGQVLWKTCPFVQVGSSDWPSQTAAPSPLFDGPQAQANAG